MPKCALPLLLLLLCGCAALHFSAHIDPIE